jgi:hypothetical protein
MWSSCLVLNVQFSHIAHPGCSLLACCCGASVAGVMSLRVQQLDVKAETKTKDNVFCNFHISVQYQVWSDLCGPCGVQRNLLRPMKPLPARAWGSGVRMGLGAAGISACVDSSSTGWAPSVAQAPCLRPSPLPLPPLVPFLLPGPPGQAVRRILPPLKCAAADQLIHL